MKTLILSLLSIWFLYSHAQLPQLQWAQVQETFAENIHAISTSNEEKIALVGFFYDSLDLDPSAARFMVYDSLSSNSVSAGFLALYDSLGNFENGLSLSAQFSSAEVNCTHVKFLSNGKIAIAGYFRGGLHFNNQSVAQSNPSWDVFIGLVDQNLQYEWIKVYRSGVATINGNPLTSGVDYPVDLAIDSSSNIYLAFRLGQSSNYYGFRDQNNNLYADGEVLNHAIMKLSETGSELGYGTLFCSNLYQIALDELDQIFLSFSAGSQTWINNLTENINAQEFALMKFTSDFHSYQVLGSYGGNSLSRGYGLLYHNGYLYSSGSSYLGIAGAPSPSNKHQFLLKTSGMDGSLSWIKQAHSTTSNDLFTYEIKLYDNKILMLSSYVDSLLGSDFSLGSNGSRDLGLIAYDTSGNLAFARSLGSSGVESQKIHLNEQGENLILSSYTGGICNFSLESTPVNMPAFKQVLARYTPQSSTLIPDLDLVDFLVFCPNESAILQSNLASNNYIQVWNTGDTSAFIFPSQSGKYWLNVYDLQNQFLISDTIDVLIENLLLDLGNDTIVNDTCFVISSDLSLGSFEWSTGSNNSSIEVCESGTYSLLFTSEFGCVYNDEIFIDLELINSLSSRNKVKFQVYPNPCSEELHVEFEHTAPFTIKLYDTLGKLQLFSDKNTIDISQLQSGFYHIILNSSNESSYACFQKQ